MKRVGTRVQVMHGNAKQTGGGLKKKDLKYNKHGKIVSKKASAVATKKMKGGGTNIQKYEMKGGDSFYGATYTLTGINTHMNVILCKIPSKGTRILSLSKYHLIRINILNIILSLNMGLVDIFTKSLGKTTYGGNYTLTHTRESSSEIQIILPSLDNLQIGKYEYIDFNTIEGTNELIFFKLLRDLVTTKYQGEYDKRRDLFEKFYSDRTTLISIHNTNAFFNELKTEFTTIKSRKSEVNVPDYDVIVPIMHYYIFAVNNHFDLPPDLDTSVRTLSNIKVVSPPPLFTMKTSNPDRYTVGDLVHNMGEKRVTGRIVDISKAESPTITIQSSGKQAELVTMTTSKPDKYIIGQQVYNMGLRHVNGHIYSIYAGTITIQPSSTAANARARANAQAAASSTAASTAGQGGLIYTDGTTMTDPGEYNIPRAKAVNNMRRQMELSRANAPPLPLRPQASPGASPAQAQVFQRNNRPANLMNMVTSLRNQKDLKNRSFSEWAKKARVSLQSVGLHQQGPSSFSDKYEDQSKIGLEEFIKYITTYGHTMHYSPFNEMAARIAAQTEVSLPQQSPAAPPLPPRPRVQNNIDNKILALREEEALKSMYINQISILQTKLGILAKKDLTEIDLGYLQSYLMKLRSVTNKDKVKDMILLNLELKNRFNLTVLTEQSTTTKNTLKKRAEFSSN